MQKSPSDFCSTKGAGFALAPRDATGLASADIRVTVDTSEALFTNSTAVDQITIADVGAACYIAGPDTLAKTDGTGTRSAYGTITGIHSSGKVWAVPTLKK